MSTKKLVPLNLAFVPYDPPFNNLHLLVLEFIEGEPMDFNDQELVRKLDKCQQKLREVGFDHQDIRSENVLVTLTGDVKHIDFGLCSVPSET
jgi:tRNA A-37 threonylcarbamoyl transferase component Bud32